MKRSLCILLGILMLALAGVLQLSNEAENARAAHASAAVTAELRSGILDRKAPTTEATCDYVGILSIPKLKLELPVHAGWSEELLKTAPCRFSGSIAEEDLVIMAHNYRAHFGPIRRLTPGDEVLLTDLSGVTIRFCVSATAKIDPNDIKAVTESGYALTLFTCTYGAESRTAVFCTADP